MGQVVKYVVGLYPRAVKIVKLPWPGLLEVLKRLHQLALAGCLITLLLTISGGGWQPQGKTGRSFDLAQIAFFLPGNSGPAAIAATNKEDDGAVIMERGLDGQGCPDSGSERQADAAEAPFQDNPEVLPPQPPSPAAASKLPYLRSVAGAGKRVAITFDDGPFLEWTERYLRVLEATQTPATFFMIGMQAAQQPQLVKAVLAGGHEVGSHSWRHANLSKGSVADIEADLQRAAVGLEQIVGEPVKYFRPPYGALSPDLLATAEKTGVRTVNWSVDPRDWSNPGPQVIVQRVMDSVHEGSIILLHEAHAGTLTALPILIKKLRDQGYELVTVSELIEAGEP